MDYLPVRWALESMAGIERSVPPNAKRGGEPLAAAAASTATKLSETPAELRIGYPAPNPSRQGRDIVLDVELPTSSHVQLDVYDMLGRRVASSPAEELSPGVGQLQLDTEHLSPGVYAVTIQVTGAPADRVVENRRFTIVR